MRPLTNLQDIEYGVFDASDAEDMARLLGDAFSRRDPPAIAIGVTASEFSSFVRLFCPKAADEGLTILARNPTTRELVGALLTEDRASELPDGVDSLDPKFDPVFDILGELDAEYRGGKEPIPGESLHLFLLGVAESAAGQGIAQQLVSTCLDNGAVKGYRLAVTEATNKTSQHIFRKLGFTERVTRSYESHRFQGRAVFGSIAEHGGPILMDKSFPS
jgi:ribosomal protein S18 acetylase RimI-like enzyme